MLKIFKEQPQGTSILDDFDFYEEKANARRTQKRGNSESTYGARFSDDSKSMVCIFLFRAVMKHVFKDIIKHTFCYLIFIIELDAPLRKMCLPSLFTSLCRIA
jgi:hypothetical protein